MDIIHFSGPCSRNTILFVTSLQNYCFKTDFSTKPSTAHIAARHPFILLATVIFFTRILQRGCVISGPCLHFWVLLQTDEFTHHFLLSNFLFRNYWYANILIQGCSTCYQYHASFRNLPWSDMNIYKVDGLYSYNLVSALHFLSRSWCRSYSFYTVLKGSCSVRSSYISLLSQCQENTLQGRTMLTWFYTICSLLPGHNVLWHPEDYAGH